MDETIPLKPAPGRGKLLDIPARRMWGWGNEGLHGYCGETSFQMAALYFGNWVSQEHVRRADGDEELLIGENEEEAAANLSLAFDTFDGDDDETPQGPEFADWVREHIDEGHPVIAGFTLATDDGPEQEYDHIMPVVGYALDDDGDVSGLYYFDLAGQQLRLADADDLVGETDPASRAPYEYFFNWSLHPDEKLYAIAILGNEDDDEELLRTRVTVNRWDEPDWGAEDGLDEQPVLVQLSATVYDLEPGRRYRILRFDDPDEVPSEGFAEASSDADGTIDFTARAATQVVDLGAFLSDGTHFFRTIEADD